MKKIGLILFGLLVLVIGTLNVDAVNQNTAVHSNMTWAQCLNFHNNSKTITTRGYFGHCVEASCSSTTGGVWETRTFAPQAFHRCSNGNRSPFQQNTKNGCSSYRGCCTGNCNRTPPGRVRYCSRIIFYDCNRTSSGAAFVPRNTTTVRTTSRTTTRRVVTTTRPPFGTTRPTTTVSKSSNNNLASLTVTPGQLTFNPNTTTYTIVIAEDVTEIEVTATAAHDKARVTVRNNKDIDVEVPITITVRAEDNSRKVYTINLSYQEPELSSNSSLSVLNIVGYKLNFSPELFTYDLRIGDVDRLDIEVKVEDENANYQVVGNANLTNKSKITITVTAEDGSKSTYLINIIKSSSDIVGILIIIVILGSAAFVGFKLFSQFQMKVKEKESTYEYE